MQAARYVFSLISLVLLGTAIGMFLAPHREQDALPLVLAVLGFIVAFLAWRVCHFRNRQSDWAAGDDIGDIAPLGRDHGHDALDGGADE